MSTACLYLGACDGQLDLREAARPREREQRMYPPVMLMWRVESVFAKCDAVLYTLYYLSPTSTAPVSSRVTLVSPLSASLTPLSALPRLLEARLVMDAEPRWWLQVAVT